MFNDVTDQYVIKQYGMPKGKYEKTLIHDKVPFDTRFISLIQKTLRPNKKNKCVSGNRSENFS